MLVVTFHRLSRSCLELPPEIAYRTLALPINSMETARFFTDLRSLLDDARHAFRHTVGQLFEDLAPLLTEAKRLESQLDRSEARRFNALKYLRTDELGLSRIIADLLDPHADHGQGAVFLEKLLVTLKEQTPIDPGAGLDLCQVSVTPELTITGDRRIDVVVEIADGRKKYALAVENKPYADDQRHQVRDYLRYLRMRFGRNFLLIYLSPTGEGPTEWSVSRRQLLTDWRQHFAILPYDQARAATEPDGYEAFRLPFSLTDWLESCRKASEADRLRWFLDETRRFCQRTFGGHTMTSNLESNTIRDFLFRNPEHFDTALAVIDSWTSIRDEVCNRFFDRVCSRIKSAEKLEPYAEDLHIESAYGGDTARSNCIWLYRDRWPAYSVPDTSRPPQAKGRIAILLRADGRLLCDWLFGIRRPLPDGDLSDDERNRRRRLDEELLGVLGPSLSRSDGWPWWVYADEDKRHWNSLVPALYRECEADEDGDITRYFVDTFVDFAIKAIPVIDDIEV